MKVVVIIVVAIVVVVVVVVTEGGGAKSMAIDATAAGVDWTPYRSIGAMDASELDLRAHGG